jgi:hypothetical protein
MEEDKKMKKMKKKRRKKKCSSYHVLFFPTCARHLLRSECSPSPTPGATPMQRGRSPHASENEKKKAKHGIKPIVKQKKFTNEISPQ